MSPSRTCQLRPCSNNNRMLQILKQMINIWTIFGFLIIKTLSLLWYISFRFKISHIYNFLDLIFLTWHIDFFFFFFFDFASFQFLLLPIDSVDTFYLPPKNVADLHEFNLFQSRPFQLPVKIKMLLQSFESYKSNYQKERIYLLQDKEIIGSPSYCFIIFESN